MSSEEEMRFSIRADVPKENMRVLDNVLNELFGTLSNKMKQAGELLESVKMRPPRMEGPTKEPESESDSDMPDLVSDSDSESEEEEEDDVEEEESPVEDGAEQEELPVEEEEYTEADYDADTEEVDHIFLVVVDGNIQGYSPTLRGALQEMEDVYGEFIANHTGQFRTEGTSTSLTVYRKTPHLWFMFSEYIVLDVQIQVITKV